MRPRWIACHSPAPASESKSMMRVTMSVRPLMLMALVVSCSSPTTIASQTPVISRTEAVATTAPVPSLSAFPSVVTTGTITGRLGYPSDFVPQLTVYAISISDSSVWFSTDTPRFGNPLSATLPPGPTWPSSGPGTYRLSGIRPGTYFVIAYRNDGNPGVGVYTPWTAKCSSSDPTVPSPPPGPCSSEHTLLPVTLLAGQTVSYVDIVDWAFPPQAGSYPSRPR